MVSATEKAIWNKIVGFRDDPIGFGVKCLNIKPKYVWSAMRTVCEGVRDHQKTAIRAGHSVSKTFTLGQIVVPWFKTCFQPSTVITTAPSDNQVKNQLWREISASVNSAKIPLGGHLTSLMWDMKPSQGILEQIKPDQRANWEKNFAIGFSTSPDTQAEHATKMHGWHNIWVLVVIDEGCGVHPQIIRTALESLITDENCKIVIGGNPTDPESEMAKACYSSDIEKMEGTEPYVSDEGWYVITIDARTNPNYIQRKRVIPGLASYEWVESMRIKYGEDGDGFRYRVKGLFPTHKEGTYYGALLAIARKDGRVGEFPYDPVYPVYSFSDYGDHWTCTLFVQFRKGRIRVISDYWDYEGLGAPAWARMMDAKDYIYRGHVAGPDMNPQTGSNKKPFATGKLLRDTLLELGYSVEPCEKHDFDSGINAVKDIFSLLEINEPECPNFLWAIGGYGKPKNLRLSTDDRPVYHDQPAKTTHRHLADATRHLAVMYKINNYTGVTLAGMAPKRKEKSHRPRSAMC